DSRARSDACQSVESGADGAIACFAQVSSRAADTANEAQVRRASVDASRVPTTAWRVARGWTPAKRRCHRRGKTDEAVQFDFREAFESFREDASGRRARLARVDADRGNVRQPRHDGVAER